MWAIGVALHVTRWCEGAGRGTLAPMSEHSRWRVAALFSLALVGGVVVFTGQQRATAAGQRPATTTATATAAPTRAPLDVSTFGPQVGQQVPDFSLADQHGKVWTRQSIMGPKGAMLVFVRSADW